MHVAIVSHYCLPHVGGVEMVVEALASRLARRHTVTLVSSAWGGLAGVSREGARTTWRLPAFHLTERFGVPYPVPLGPHVGDAMAAVAQADVVHVHGALYAQGVFARRAARRARRAVVLTEHVGFVPYASAVVKAVQRAAWNAIGDGAVRSADAVTTLGERVRGWLAARSGRDDIAVIPNGVDTARFAPPTPAQRAAARGMLGLPADGTLVLFVGRAAGKKNLEQLLAIPRDGFTLVTCGAERGGRLDGVADLGVLAPEAMPAAYQACDLLAHPAEGEGFPLAVQEAMAAGLPVVLRWDPGYASTVARDAVQSVDDVPSFARALAGLVRDGAARGEAGARGRAWAMERWSWDVTVAAYERVYAAAIDARGRRGR
ncbi:MAG: glycosyltransferase family 4 protein [Gemmatimonadetes bacterium]|nr:glycosyltransferase family 4 protein [Gemmatimonadota bacterium]